VDSASEGFIRHFPHPPLRLGMDTCQIRFFGNAHRQTATVGWRKRL
jgi:hypothetical protein